MPITHRSARRLPLCALGLAVLAGCQDRDLPTAAEPMNARFAQTETAPVVNSLADDESDGCAVNACTLREAIVFASTGATVTFSASLTGTITLTQAADLVIDKDLTITGPGASSLGVSGNDVVHHVFSIRAGATVTLSGLTITGGYAYTYPDGYGGGIENAGTLSVTDCIVSGNRGGSGGGGIGNSGTLALTNTVVRDNQTVFEGNQGGGIYNNAGTVTLSGSTVSGNYAEQGGGIVSRAGTLVISNSVISGNEAGYAGGISVVEGTTTITMSTIADNFAEYVGGIENVWGALTLARSTVSGNRAFGGGGVASRTNAGDASQHTTILNSTISGNDVGPPYEGYEGDFFGGGVFNGGGLTRIILSTVTANHAATSGGGVYSSADAGSGTAVTVVKGSLIWGNTSGTDTPDDVAAFSATDNEYQSLGYNLLGAAGSFAASFGGTGDATGITNALVGPLADNGGPTKTHALLAVSPALDTGTCRDHTNATVGTDQRGTTRPQSGYCDKGAFESSTFWSSCTYTAAAKNGARSVTVRWGNATPGVTKISVAGANPAEKVLAPSIGGSWTTSTRMVPTYGLWVGTSRKDTGTTLVAAGTACTAQ